MGRAVGRDMSRAVTIAALLAGCLLLSAASRNAPVQAQTPILTDTLWAEETLPSTESPRLAIAPAAARAVSWLRDQQADDGGWHSQTYGQMKTGAGNTALLALALAEWRAVTSDRLLQQAIDQQLAAALTFLLRHQSPAGHVRSSAESTDYPTYTTALTLLTLQRLERSAVDQRPAVDQRTAGDERAATASAPATPGPSLLNNWPADELVVKRSRFADYLVAAQLAGSHGYHPGQLAYGGWDSTGGDERIPARFVQADVAVTTLVLQALAGEQSGDRSLAIAQQAAVFLARCQHAADGGFWFTAEADDPRNKAGMNRPGGSAIPYATATIDGIIAWQAVAALATQANRQRAQPLGQPSSPLPATARERAAAGLAWMQRHPTAAAIPGLDADETTRLWNEGLRYYYWAGLAKLLPDYPEPVRSQLTEELMDQLLPLQSSAGFWRNSVNAMREDDPLIATALALLALSRLSESLESDD